MTKEEFKTRTTVATILEERGIRVPNSKRFVVKCPFHDDRNPSFSVDNERGLWKCHAGCGGGDVFNLLARFEDSSVEDVLKRYVPMAERKYQPSRTPAQLPKSDDAPEVKPQIERIYNYTDENGTELFQCVRYKPKDFKQRHQHDGQWVWNLQGVRRVLYRLPEVLKADTVIVTEGEKDVDNLRELGFVATCNPLGGGKWLDSYTEFLAGREVILCGDNDDKGREHTAKVLASIGSAAKNVRCIKVPLDFKDVSEYIAACPSKSAAKEQITNLIKAAPLMVKGAPLPIKALWEIEDSYREHISNLERDRFDLGGWIPTLGRKMRPLVPGELVTIIAGTGVGKTGVLQNIARHAAPLATLFFEMELPEELLYERFIGVASGWSAKQVESTFKEAIAVNQRMGKENGMERLSHVFVCTESRLTVSTIEQYILRSEVKIGERPKVVLVDYIQLLQGSGPSRYERMSNVAEELKIMAKSTRTIVFLASQIHRKESDDPEVYLSDAKDSGSIENSSGLVLGLWRDPKDKTKSTLLLKILKNTKGISGETIKCNFHGESMRVTEQAEEPTHY